MVRSHRPLAPQGLVVLSDTAVLLCILREADGASSSNLRRKPNRPNDGREHAAQSAKTTYDDVHSTRGTINVGHEFGADEDVLLVHDDPAGSDGAANADSPIERGISSFVNEFSAGIQSPDGVEGSPLAQLVSVRASNSPGVATGSG